MILKCLLIEDNHTKSLSEVSRKCGLNRTSVYREIINRRISKGSKRKLIYASLTELMIYKYNIRNDEYRKGMLKASKDPKFIKRNEEIIKEFEEIDTKIEDE